MDSAEPSAVGTAVAAAVAVFAALISLVIGLRTLKLQKQIAEEQAERHYAFEGAMAAITWRAEVFALHDSGTITEPDSTNHAARGWWRGLREEEQWPHR